MLLQQSKRGMRRLSRIFQYSLFKSNENCSGVSDHYSSVTSQVYTLSPGLK